MPTVRQGLSAIAVAVRRPPLGQADFADDSAGCGRARTMVGAAGHLQADGNEAVFEEIKSVSGLTLTHQRLAGRQGAETKIRFQFASPDRAAEPIGKVLSKRCRLTFVAGPGL